MYNAPGDVIRSSFKIAFGINADNWFCIACTQVHPIIVKFYFKPIFGIYRMVFVFTLKVRENFFNVNTIIYFYFVFADEIIRICFTFDMLSPRIKSAD